MHWYTRLSRLLPAPVAAILDAAADRWQRCRDPLGLRAVAGAALDVGLCLGALIGVGVVVACVAYAEFAT